MSCCFFKTPGFAFSFIFFFSLFLGFLSFVLISYIKNKKIRFFFYFICFLIFFLFEVALCVVFFAQRTLFYESFEKTKKFIKFQNLQKKQTFPVILISDNKKNIIHGAYFHGKGVCIEDNKPIIQEIVQKLGLSLVMIGYPGYNGSGGKNTEKTIKQAAIKQVKEHLIEKGRTNLFLYGDSLGVAVALYVASVYPLDVKYLCLVNGFLSIPAVISRWFFLFRWWPFSALCMDPWYVLETIEKIKENDFKNKVFVFFSAQKDPLVPSEHMEKIYNLVRKKNPEHATLVKFDSNKKHEGPTIDFFVNKVQQVLNL